MSQHDVMVRNKALELIGCGFRNVRVHLPGYTRPDAIPAMCGYGTYIPDVTGFAPDGTFHVFEIETERDGLNCDHTFQQCLAFGAYSLRAPGVKAWLTYPAELDAVGEAVANGVNAFLASIHNPPSALGSLYAAALQPQTVYGQWGNFADSYAAASPSQTAYGSLPSRLY